MFEFIRTHQRLMQFLLLLFVSPFLLSGLHLLSFGDTDNAVAKVGNKTISQSEFDAAVQAEGARVALLPDGRKRVLDRLIADRALNQEALLDRISPTDAEIATAVTTFAPQLADPKLSKEERALRYQEFAAQQRMTIAGLESKIRMFLISQRLAGEIDATAFVPNSVVARLSDFLEQQREVQQLPFKTSDFVAQVKVTDEMQKDYYSKNPSLYQNPEQTKIEYVVLSADKLGDQVNVSDEDAQKYYDANKAQYATEEQRRASHILIAVKAKASDADKAAAKAKAEKLLAEVRKNPADFAKLAKENSDDPGSAERGGDLDYFGAKAMVKPFSDAVQKMKVGDISDLVQSDYGYHIILLTGIKPAEVKPFDAVKGDIVAAKKKEAAKKLFSDLRDTFDHTVFEQSDSLKPVVAKLADKAKLTVEAATVTRKPDPGLAQTVAYNNPKFLNAIFVDDVLKNKHNTDAIEVRDGVVISGRVTQYQAASQKPFEEVQAQVRDAVVQVEAHKLAQKAAAAKFAELQTKDDASGFEAAKVISRKEPAGFESSVWQSLTKADTTKLPAFVQLEVPGQGYSVFRINKVIPPVNPDPSVKTQVQRAVASQEATLYVEALKQKAKVKILRPSVLTATGPASPVAQPSLGDLDN
ncbi:MAG TPA: peptidylprolyl isomerase [Burkholderiaceae bacterium]|jgi:peptidyl-prolyl cis-trans isomerase D